MKEWFKGLTPSELQAAIKRQANEPTYEGIPKVAKVTLVIIIAVLFVLLTTLA